MVFTGKNHRFFLPVFLLNGFEVNDSSVALYSPITVHPMELVLMYWMRGARGPDPTRLSPHHGDGEFEAAR